MNKQVFILALLIGIIYGGKKLLKNVQYFLKADEIRRELEPKFEGRAWEISQSELYDFVQISSKTELKTKEDNWKQLCEAQLDFNCRLYADLIYLSQNKSEGLRLALKYCKVNNLQACIAASKMKGFDNSHPDFFNVTNQIISQCEDEMAALKDADFWACDYYTKK
tara:strand:+ start:142263 stop:142760 length:498 start_codon:yes stop_codon:yes gene_type:complete